MCWVKCLSWTVGYDFYTDHNELSKVGGILQQK